MGLRSRCLKAHDTKQIDSAIDRAHAKAQGREIQLWGKTNVDSVLKKPYDEAIARAAAKGIMVKYEHIDAGVMKLGLKPT